MWYFYHYWRLLRGCSRSRNAGRLPKLAQHCVPVRICIFPMIRQKPCILPLIRQKPLVLPKKLNIYSMCDEDILLLCYSTAWVSTTHWFEYKKLIFLNFQNLKFKVGDNGDIFGVKCKQNYGQKVQQIK